ncbi:hypothetical protein FACS189441_4110 [Betaproteobacteria bacterium]|nr:hypothetical protein FACS189441_4110 [Betaproteobacteria bacterium]
MKMNTSDEGMTQKLTRFETVQEGCGLMTVIRRAWIRDEKRKEFSDQEQIRQWETEASQFFHERLDLRFEDLEAQARIYREYNPQIKAYFQEQQKKSAVKQQA